VCCSLRLFAVAVSDRRPRAMAVACLTLACCVRPSSALLLSSHLSSSSSPASADSSAITTLVGSLHTTTTGVVVGSDSNGDVGGGGAAGGDYAGGQELHDWTWRRRGVISAAALAMLSAFGCNCPSSHAFSLGISGPKEWLKGQKQKTAKFLFAPINASRDRLDSARLLLCEYRWTLN
jgi:hypothetical protein